MYGSGPRGRIGLVNVLPVPPPLVKPGSRHTRVPAVPHGNWTSPTFPVLSPDGTMHLFE